MYIYIGGYIYTYIYIYVYIHTHIYVDFYYLYIYWRVIYTYLRGKADEGNKKRTSKSLIVLGHNERETHSFA